MNQITLKGVVVSCSRRNATILLPPHRVVPARIGSKIDELIVGDRVTVREEADRFIVGAREERGNCLSRTLGQRTKTIAANLDRLFLVTAVEPLFNTAFVDRVLVVCALQHIPVHIVVNKCDLGTEETDYLIATYAELGFDLSLTSAKDEGGLRQLLPALANPELHTVALAGVSGVGKSSILNVLIPNAQQRTGSVSRKTGKGTQTTSMAQGYLYGRQESDDLLIVDLPGIQNFGVSNLEPRMVADSFPEFLALRDQCEYADCKHTAEPNCAVSDALDEGVLAASRYLSYIGILEEIEKNKPY